MKVAIKQTWNGICPTLCSYSGDFSEFTNGWVKDNGMRKIQVVILTNG
jgi:hypothetical protein